MDNTPEVATAGKPIGARVEAVRGFFQSVQSEMKKVTWPTRDELIKATRMIVVLSIVLGIVIGIMDWVLQLIFVDGVARLAR